MDFSYLLLQGTGYKIIIDMSNRIDIDQHKKILGTLYVVFSMLNIVLVIVAVLVASAIIPFHIHGFEELLAVTFVKYAIISLVIILTTPALIVGIGLLYKREWALTLALVLGIVGLFGFPFWTFIGVYSIVLFILAQNEKKPSKSITEPSME